MVTCVFSSAAHQTILATLGKGAAAHRIKSAVHDNQFLHCCFWWEQPPSSDVAASGSKKQCDLQVGCPEGRIDENVARLTGAGYKVYTPTWSPQHWWLATLQVVAVAFTSAVWLLNYAH